MEFKDYYLVMGLEKGATPDDIKRTHRKLARKYHPDVSKEKDAEARFKELTEAYDVLKDPEKRAAYDRLGANYKAGQEFQPPPDWDAQQAKAGSYSQGFADADHKDHSAFFDALFRSMERGQPAGQHRSSEQFDMHGQDQHAAIQIAIEDAYSGATRTLQLRVQAQGEDGRTRLTERTIEFSIPKGIRAGQHIRLAAQGGPGIGNGRPGDLYLDVEIVPHPLYRTEGHDVLMNLPIAPWEAALGTHVVAPTPTGQVEVKIPAGSVASRKLRVKGRGLPGRRPGDQPGDFYFVLKIVQPVTVSDADKKAYTDLHASFHTFNPRAQVEAIEKTLSQS